MTASYEHGFRDGYTAAMNYLRNWPQTGPMAPYFGSAKHFADALWVNRDAIVPNPQREESRDG